MFIPKDIRKKLNIKNYDNLEININNNELIIKKYSFLNNLDSILKSYIDALSFVYKVKVLITDKEKIILCSKNIKDSYIKTNLSTELIKYINNEINLLNDKINIVDNLSINDYLIKKLILNNEIIGCIIIYDNNTKNLNIEPIMKMLNIFINYYNDI